MTPHGPDAAAFEKHSHTEMSPFKMADTMAFMFESNYVFRLSDYAQKHFDKDYWKCWQGLKNYHTDAKK